MLTISSIYPLGKGPTTTITTTTLKAAHAAELKRVQAELEKHREQSTKLESVEHKIRIVEEVRDLASAALLPESGASEQL